MKLNVRNYQAGIDLGTSNSAISIVDQNGIKLLEISGGEELLPSCVYFSKDKKRYVGMEARNLMTLDPGNGHIEFKRKMGSITSFPIKNLNTTLVAEELSGLVLKKLQEVYKNYFNEELRTSIVTVPARFDLKAVDATRVSAMGNYKFNGMQRVQPQRKSPFYSDFLQMETLMEPVAASMAYGMERNVNENGKWLVFDLGGGTFDAAVVTYVDGTMDVKYHGGDNFLGGSSFVRKVLKHVHEVLSKKYDLDNFFTHKKYDVAISILLDMIEKLIINLSSSNEAVLNIPRPEFKDNKGKTVEAEIVITRELYNTIIGPTFQQTIEICHNTLRSNNIKSSDLDRVLLVGGPTQYPYFRQQIEEQLKIPIDYSLNPMTAVATGAALFGASREIPDEVKPEIIEIVSKVPTDCNVTINCTNNTQQTVEILTGIIALPNNDLNTIESVSIYRSDKGWESGNLQVDPTDGSFFAEIHLRENSPNIFNIKVNGKGGSNFAVNPSEFQIIHGGAVGGMVAPYSLNVTEEGNKCSKVIKKDTELPVAQMKMFYTTREIKKDDKSDEAILYIEITEGESANPNENIHIGKLNIPNKDLRRTLPINTEVEITIEQSSDRRLTASCYIPFTKQSFDAEIQIKREETEIKSIEDSYETFISNYESAENYLSLYGNEKWQSWFNDLTIETDMLKLKSLMSDEFAEIKDSDNLHDNDILNSIKTLITESKYKLEVFNKEFAPYVLTKKIQKLKEGLSKNDTIIGEKIKQWEERINSYNSFEIPNELVEDIDSQLTQYDKLVMGFSFLYKLDLFTGTRMNSYVNFLNEIAAELRTAALKYNSYDLLAQFNSQTDEWNRKIKTVYYNPIQVHVDRLPHQLHPFLDRLDDEELYPVNDYDKIVKILNPHNSVYDFNIIEKIAKLGRAKKDVLKKAIAFAKAYKEGYVDVIDEKFDDFAGCYYVDPNVQPKGSFDGGSGSGPVIRS